jgi:hypothetical protein
MSNRVSTRRLSRGSLPAQQRTFGAFPCVVSLAFRTMESHQSSETTLKIRSSQQQQKISTPLRRLLIQTHQQQRRNVRELVNKRHQIAL